MKRKLLNLVVLCLFAGLAAGFIPMAADAQDGTNQKPQLLIKIHNIDQFLNDIEKLMPRTQGSKAIPPTAMARGMLQGTGWIDPQRSIVASMVSKDAKSKWVILIPFRTANPNFQRTINAIAGDDYYLAAFPPEPGFTVNPAIKESLLSASTAAATGSLVIEAAVGPASRRGRAPTGGRDEKNGDSSAGPNRTIRNVSRRNPLIYLPEC